MNPWGEAQAAKLKVREQEKRIGNLESDLLSARVALDDSQAEAARLKADLTKYQVPTGSPMLCPACSGDAFVNLVPATRFYRVEGAAPIAKAMGAAVTCWGCRAVLKVSESGVVLAEQKKPPKEAPTHDGVDSYQKDLTRLGR